MIETMRLLAKAIEQNTINTYLQQGAIAADEVFKMLKEVENRLDKLERSTTKEKCPICKYEIPMCQCRFSGSAHPDRSKRRSVVLDHLYLLSPKQLEHVINLEKDWQVSYGDEERTKIYEDMKNGE